MSRLGKGHVMDRRQMKWSKFREPLSSHRWGQFEPWHLLVFFFGVIVGLYMGGTPELPDISPTIASGLIAGLAALAASWLTGLQFLTTERIKHEREVMAVKRGVTHELTWALEHVSAAWTGKPSKGNPYQFRATLMASVIPHGLKVFDRAADKISITGDNFTGFALVCYGVLRSKIGTDPGQRAVSEFGAPDFARLLVNLWQLAAYLEDQNDTQEILVVSLSRITEKWFVQIMVAHGQAEFPLDEPDAPVDFSPLVQYIKENRPQLLEAASRMAKLSLPAVQ